jgi:REP element-mobilizing transposase RayT
VILHLYEKTQLAYNPYFRSKVVSVSGMHYPYFKLVYIVKQSISWGVDSMQDLPQRKQLRIKDYDYSQAGYYFVTICTHNRQNLLGTFHIHFVAQLTGRHGDLPLHRLVGQFKSYTTKLYNDVLWQRNYYEHIIRNQQEYEKIYDYIKHNPAKWQEDKYYV